MNSYSKWQLKRALEGVVSKLQGIYRNAPEGSQALTGTGWSYREWAYFHAAKGSWGGAEDALGRLVKASGANLPDFLLAFSIRTDSSARAAAFTSKESLRTLLMLVAEVVLEKLPREFEIGNWVDERLAAGAEPLLPFRA